MGSGVQAMPSSSTDVAAYILESFPNLERFHVYLNRHMNAKEEVEARLRESVDVQTPSLTSLHECSNQVSTNQLLETGVTQFPLTK